MYAQRYYVVYDKKIYDLYDFGNLIWGATVRWLNFSYLTVFLGSNYNEMKGSWKDEGFSFLRFDSAKDQSAIKKGYYSGYKWLFEDLDPSKSIEENIH